MGPIVTIESVHEKNLWVWTPGQCLPPEFQPFGGKQHPVVHRPQCELIQELPNIRECSPPEMHAGYYWDYYMIINDSSKENFDLGTTSCEPFELLTKCWLSDSPYSWMFFDFCDECVPQDAVSYVRGQFLQMLAPDDLAKTLVELSELMIDECIDDVSTMAMYDLVKEVAQRLKSGDQDAIDLINKTKE